MLRYWQVHISRTQLFETEMHDNAIHLYWINLYPVDCAIGFPYDPSICYDTSLSARKRYQPWFDKKNRTVLCFLSPQFNFVTQLYLFALFVEARTRVLETETAMIS